MPMEMKSKRVVLTLKPWDNSSDNKLPALSEHILEVSEANHREKSHTLEAVASDRGTILEDNREHATNTVPIVGNGLYDTGFCFNGNADQSQPLYVMDLKTSIADGGGDSLPSCEGHRQPFDNFLESDENVKLGRFSFNSEEEVMVTDGLDSVRDIEVCQTETNEMDRVLAPSAPSSIDGLDSIRDTEVCQTETNKMDLVLALTAPSSRDPVCHMSQQELQNSVENSEGDEDRILVEQTQPLERSEVAVKLISLVVPAQGGEEVSSNSSCSFDFDNVIVGTEVTQTAYTDVIPSYATCTDMMPSYNDILQSTLNSDQPGNSVQDSFVSDEGEVVNKSFAEEESSIMEVCPKETGEFDFPIAPVVSAGADPVSGMMPRYVLLNSKDIVVEVDDDCVTDDDMNRLERSDLVIDLVGPIVQDQIDSCLESGADTLIGSSMVGTDLTPSYVDDNSQNDPDLGSQHSSVQYESESTEGESVNSSSDEVVHPDAEEKENASEVMPDVVNDYIFYVMMAPENECLDIDNESYYPSKMSSSVTIDVGSSGGGSHEDLEVDNEIVYPSMMSSTVTIDIGSPGGGPQEDLEVEAVFGDVSCKAQPEEQIKGLDRNKYTKDYSELTWSRPLYIDLQEPSTEVQSSKLVNEEMCLPDCRQFVKADVEQVQSLHGDELPAYGRKSVAEDTIQDVTNLTESQGALDEQSLKENMKEKSEFNKSGEHENSQPTERTSGKGIFSSSSEKKLQMMSEEPVGAQGDGFYGFPSKADYLRHKIKQVVMQMEVEKEDPSFLEELEREMIPPSSNISRLVRVLKKSTASSHARPLKEQPDIAYKQEIQNSGQVINISPVVENEPFGDHSNLNSHGKDVLSECRYVSSSLETFHELVPCMTKKDQGGDRGVDSSVCPENKESLPADQRSEGISKEEIEEHQRKFRNTLKFWKLVNHPDDSDAWKEKMRPAVTSSDSVDYNMQEKDQTNTEVQLKLTDALGEMFHFWTMEESMRQISKKMKRQ
ncbi:hypothetical protein BSL78_07789 [Apostichopus japonicus]|uniref:Uncharacterized protein n=1 Tax=Stichopus japonicus TaxID=307972 RepID=A0A2G8L4X4_STIJA|nr:hypothetical protein BSL78_07789 [Apostichopus japonicus]